VYAGSGFALQTIQQIINENRHIEYVSIVLSETPQQTLNVFEMYNIHESMKKKSQITCELSYISETSEYVPVFINGEKRIVKKSIVSDLDLFQEIDKANFACTGNFFVSRDFFGSFVDVPLKKVRQKKDKKILDHVYSDMVEQFYNCNFVISSLENKDNVSHYLTEENLKKLIGLESNV
jgi:hypothetical protein